MVSQDDVRRVAMSLPGVVEDPDAFRFLVDGKLIAWSWLERVDPRRARVPNAGVLVVRLADESEKEVLMEMDAAAFFTEPHYDGYPAILVRLEAVDAALLERLIADAWRTRAPKRLLGAAGPGAQASGRRGAR